MSCPYKQKGRLPTIKPLSSDSLSVHQRFFYYEPGEAGEDGCCY